MRNFPGALRALSFLALLLAGFAFTTQQAKANPDTCIEDGGTAQCTAPTSSQYQYFYASASWNSTRYATEAEAVSQFVTQVMTTYDACSGTLHNPGWQPLPPGSWAGSTTIPNPPVVGQDSWSLHYYLGLEDQQIKHYIKEDVIYGHATPPSPCGNSGSSGNVELHRERTVSCPDGYQPNFYTSPTYSYCFRAAVAYDPPKNLGPCDDCDLMVGHPVNVATGNKYLVERDYRGGGSFPLEYVRSYNSLAYRGTFAPSVGPDFYRRSPNWRGTYDRAVLHADHEVFPTARAYRPNGRVLEFRLVSGSWVPNADVNEQLTQLVDGSGNTTTPLAPQDSGTGGIPPWPCAASMPTVTWNRSTARD